ncbi:hypothetical protein VE00_05711 [Pseudogymnoascus sp. WSF 3629]|nr:hypothetical protein VE00_05711 [Pseudogymnoascus sp. WSF 3629]
MPPRKITTDPPSTYLRLKHARTTILLLTTPLRPLSALVSELLSALRERYPDGLPSLSASPAAGTSPGSNDGDDDDDDDDEMEILIQETLTPLPKSTKEIELAVQNDPYDPAAGWREIEWDGEEGEGGMKGCGVGEGGVVAFRVKGEVGWGVEWPKYDEEEEMEEMEEGEGGEEGGEGMEEEVVVRGGKGKGREEEVVVRGGKGKGREEEV